MKKYKLFLLILVLGLSIRISGFLAYQGVDESNVIRAALSYGARKSLEPTFLYYPPLSSYFFFACFAAEYLILKTLNIITSSYEFAALYLIDSYAFHISARAVSLILYIVLTAIIVYLPVKLLRAELRIFLLILVSLSGISIIYTVKALPEPFVLFSGMLSVIFGYCYLQNYSISFACASAFFAGNCAGAKYNGGILILYPVVLIIVLSLNKSISYKKMFKTLIFAGIAGLVGFAVAHPYFFINFKFYLKSLLFLSQMAKAGHIGINATNFTYYIKFLVFKDMGILYFLSLIFLFFIDRVNFFAVIITLLVMSIIAVKSSIININYILPVFPLLYFSTAIVLTAFLKKYRGTGKIILMIVFVLYFTFDFINYVDFKKDIRIAAKKFIEKNIPPNSKLAIDNMYYTYVPELFCLNRILEHKKAKKLPAGFINYLKKISITYKNYVFIPLFKKIEKDFKKYKSDYLAYIYSHQPIARNTLLKSDYIILSDWAFGRYFNSSMVPAASSPLFKFYIKARKLYLMIFELESKKKIKLVRKFKRDNKYKGPEIFVYKVVR